MFDFKEFFSSIFSGNGNDKETREQSCVLLPLKSVLVSKENSSSSLEEERILHDISEALLRAKRARDIAIKLADAGYPTTTHSRKDLTYTILEYKGRSRKNNQHVYEVVWTPVIITLSQYKKGHYNFRNEKIPVVVQQDGEYLIQVSWENGFISSKTELQFIPN